MARALHIFSTTHAVDIFAWTPGSATAPRRASIGAYRFDMQETANPEALAARCDAR